MQFVSASQIGKFRECKRLWGFTYILGLRTPSGPAAELGTEIDNEQLQPYLKDGRTFDYTRDSGHIAASILAYLPSPKLPGLEVQKYFEMPSFTQGEDGPMFGYRGYLDLFLPDSGSLPLLTPHESTIPAVVDFKSTSNFRWAKTTETLSTDVQAQLYAAWAMYATGARTIDLVWLYMLTRGKRQARRVHLRVTADHVAEQFRAIDETAVEMFRLRKTVTDPLELEPNPGHCDAYGGCPFRSRCNLSPEVIAQHHAAQNTRSLTPMEMIPMSATIDLLANLKAKKNGTLGVNSPEAELPVPPMPTPFVPVATAAPAPAPEPAPAAAAPEVAVVAADADQEPAKRGRPRGSKSTSVASPTAVSLAFPNTPYLVVRFRSGDAEVEVSGNALDGETVTDAINRLKGAA